MQYNSLKNRIQDQINLRWLLQQNIQSNLTLREIQDQIKKKTDQEPSLATIHHWRKDLEKPQKATTRSLKQRATKENREQYNKIIEIIKEIEATDPETQNKEISKEKEDLCLCLGDIHFGRETESYNLEIAEERTETLTQKIKLLIEDYISHNVHGFENLNILLLGDLIDGELVYEQQLHDIECGVLDQIKKAEKAIAKLLKWGSQRFSNVYVHTVWGNHGTNEKRTAEETNWDNIFYYILKKSLNQINNLFFDISKRRYNNLEIRGHRVHIRHGKDARDQSQTSAGQKTMANWQDLHNYDLMCLGHYHFLGVDNYNSKLILRNGALVTDDKLSERMGKKNRPRQWLFGVSDKRVPSFMYPVDLK